MPLYEYQCDACGRRIEVIVKFSDPPLEKCPTCGGPVHKLFSSPAIQFKGTGFYITDYAKKDSSTAKGEDQKGDAKADTKTEAKSETKGDTKSEKSEKSERSEKSDSKSEKTESKPTASTGGDSTPAKNST